LQEGRKK